MASRATELKAWARRGRDKLSSNWHAKGGPYIVVSVEKQLFALFECCSAFDGASIGDQMGIQMQLILLILPLLDSAERPLKG